MDDPTNDTTRWQDVLQIGYTLLLRPIAQKLGDKDGHFDKTPERVVKTLEQIWWGMDIEPDAVLNTTFAEASYDQMVTVKDITFISWCRHHLLPFSGSVHFAYLPDKKVVGLSKIPRLIEVLSARPQLQENLSHEIVTNFQRVVAPLGCGVVIEAAHSCMSCRGVRTLATTRTVALTGEFQKADVKAEFLQGVK